MIAENAYGHAKRLRWILSRTPRDHLVVEIGCGTGVMIALPMAAMGYRVLGLDTDAPSIAAGQAAFRQAGLDPNHLQTGSLEAVSARPDTIIASEVLEHIPEPALDHVLQGIRGALRPGGQLLVTVPNGYGWFELESFLWYRVGLGAVLERAGVVQAILKLKRGLFGRGPADELPSSLADSPHVQRFTHGSIRRRLARAGFEVVDVTGSVLFAGPFSNLLLTGVDPLMRLNTVAGTLVPRLAAGFYLTCRAGAPAPTDVVVVHDVRTAPAPAPGTAVVAFGDFTQSIKRSRIVGRLRRYGRARFLTHRLDVLPRPFVTALLLRWVSRGTCTLEDEAGRRTPVGPPALGRLAWRFARDLVRRGSLVRRVRREVERLAREAAAPRRSGPLHLDRSPLYLRTDFAFGVRSGGSVAHIAGVLNHLDRFAGRPIFVTTDAIPTVRDDLETHLVPPGDAFWDFPELPTIASSCLFEAETERRLGDRRPAFVYQRYSLNSYAGLRLARRYGVPFVLEYNGSEVWVNRHWGGPLRYEALSRSIERLNLAAADLIVVVSEVLKEDLVAQGVPGDKVLVNPNGVDPERYSPDVDGRDVRRRHGLEGRLVVGFIGTFGRWHGAEVLADAFGHIVRGWPDARDRVRLLLVGDGVTMPDVRTRLARAGVDDCCVLTGLVPQEDGPAHLAACDLLVSPHVPNPDGTAFFGSPTKLFEYMAMAKGIVASRLGQIAEVLAHDETAWLVPPGDADGLAGGIRTLVEDESRRARLGRAARREVVARYTWAEHTRRIVARLRERCA